MKGITVWSSGWAWLARAAGVGAGAALLFALAGQPPQASAAVRPPFGMVLRAPVTATGAVSTTADAGPAAATAAQTAGLPGHMVALGDSYTAGALLPVNPDARPAGCLRSSRAYPVLVARALGVPLTDVACASAGIKDMTSAQSTYLGTNPPQSRALGPQDSLVVLTLGGDDLGFMNVLQTCMKLSFTDPWGSPCKAHFTGGGRDVLAARVRAEAPRMARALALIAARAPRARIVLVGYPDLFPLSGGCWPRVPITGGDIAYLRGIEHKINAMLAADAMTAGATFVNTYAPTIGHDFCQRESVRDVEGLLPSSLALPFHPNARGQAAIAAAVLSALGR